ncbi:hypothetical protein M885DRAFT_510134 [Pelagophyceae sp. CCMP2097]|nr:hypothetical protein M885DRAFT_510134 [Pelagophyceae sp. CCMP2097]
MVIVYRTLDEEIYDKSREMKGNRAAAAVAPDAVSNLGGGMDFKPTRSIYDAPDATKQPTANARLAHAARVAAAALQGPGASADAETSAPHGAATSASGAPADARAAQDAAWAAEAATARSSTAPEDDEFSGVDPMRYALPQEGPCCPLPAAADGKAPSAAAAYIACASSASPMWGAKPSSLRDELRPKAPPPKQEPPAPAAVVVAPAPAAPPPPPARRLRPNEGLARELALLVGAKTLNLFKLASAYEKLYKKKLPLRGKTTQLIEGLPAGYVIVLKNGAGRRRPRAGKPQPGDRAARRPAERARRASRLRSRRPVLQRSRRGRRPRRQEAAPLNRRRASITTGSTNCFPVACLFSTPGEASPKG